MRYRITITQPGYDEPYAEQIVSTPGLVSGSITAELVSVMTPGDVLTVKCTE